VTFEIHHDNFEVNYLLNIIGPWANTKQGVWHKLLIVVSFIILSNL
jgi:hypothetical protein